MKIYFVGKIIHCLHSVITGLVVSSQLSKLTSFGYYSGFSAEVDL